MLPFLSQLWLRQADAGLLEQARAIASLANNAGDMGGLATAYTDIFLLNVFPYAGVFLDPRGELNGERARDMEALYARHGYTSVALLDVAAPDHIGLMLDFLGFVGPADSLPLLPYLLDWAPVLCLAVEREPGAHPFYVALASLTRETLFSPGSAAPHFQASPRSRAPFQRDTSLHVEVQTEPDEELTLRSVVRHLLAPARSGVFLSRARLGSLARGLGLRLPFGERFQVGLGLFEAAGGSGQVSQLVDALVAESTAWDAAYAAWATDTPGWAPYAGEWRARVAQTLRLLEGMRSAAAEGPTN